MSKRNQERRFKFPHILPEINDWPINQLYQKRDTLVKDVTQLTIQNISKRSPSEVNELIAKTIYMERIRVKATAWRVDPPNEKAFWKKIRDQHTEKSLDKETPEAHAINLKLLEQIIHRYSEEITGNFKKKTFEFARTFLTELFNRLLNAAGSRWLKKFGKRLELHQRIRTEGKIDELRALSKDHTVILVPTHFSNLDSILIGYAIDLIGVPAFSYGAGLNLYNNGLVAYYMNRLGGYRVDRPKKNPTNISTSASQIYIIIRAIIPLFSISFFIFFL